MVEPARLRQFLTYVAGGLLCAAIDVGLMHLLMTNGVHPAGAASAGFVAGLLVNYAFHSQVTFSQAATKASFARYMCVVGLNYGLTLGCVALAVAMFDSPMAGKIVSLPLVAVNGYLLGRFWIFRTS